MKDDSLKKKKNQGMKSANKNQRIIINKIKRINS